MLDQKTLFLELHLLLEADGVEMLRRPLRNV